MGYEDMKNHHGKQTKITKGLGDSTRPEAGLESTDAPSYV